MLLAIDIGNTNITMGVFRGEILMGNFRMTTQIPRTSDEFGVLIRELLRSSGFEPKDIENVIIASVVPDIMYSFTSGIKKYFCAEPIVVGPGVKTGVKIGAENPKEVGADLIVDAAAAKDIYGGRPSSSITVQRRPSSWFWKTARWMPLLLHRESR